VSTPGSLDDVIPSSALQLNRSTQHRPSKSALQISSSASATLRGRSRGTAPSARLSQCDGSPGHGDDVGRSPRIEINRMIRLMSRTWSRARL